MYRKAFLLNTAGKQRSRHFVLAFYPMLFLSGCGQAVTAPMPKDVALSTPNKKAASSKTPVGRDEPPVEGKPMLTIVLTGARSASGDYACGIFNNASDFRNRENPILSTRLPASEEPVTWKIDSLDIGTYAAGAYHDENENRKVDRNALGVPTEVYGFSNNARGKFGPPGFSDAQFTIDGTPVSLNIQLK